MVIIRIKVQFEFVILATVSVPSTGANFELEYYTQLIVII